MRSAIRWLRRLRSVLVTQSRPAAAAQLPGVREYLHRSAMSDCDSEDYSSSEDEDYVPSGGEYSEDDVNELVKEDDEPEDGEGKVSRKTEKKNNNSILSRKRKRGVLVLNSEDCAGKSVDAADISDEDHAREFDEEKKQKLEEARKKREDSLWSSFLSDVGQKAKIQTPAPSTQNSQTQSEKPEDSNVSSEQDAETAPASKKVTITKVFDFAGEEVQVTREVDSSSREAKAFIKQQKDQLDPNPIPPKTSIAASSGVKRPGGVGSILGKLGSKKQKMSTLEKSKLDWESFKDQEGIGEELAIHNRGKHGYIERKAFLERVDYRQFELEREIRLKNMKPA
ncbi:craniofacial development protein 1 [Pseudophryne corroboree]|uniref:craniofacial development protein 1 n=1 Tax=Pseudophryne corroboree TaxID=495146 RepID=UPI003081A83A